MTDDVELVARAWAKAYGFKWDDYTDGEKENCMSHVSYAITALKAAGWQKVPEGWQVVPREPSYEMVDVGYVTMRTENVKDTSEQGRIKRIYRAMLSAAPQPASAGKEE